MKATALLASGVLAGAALYALALPPFDYASCGWVVLVPLLLAIRDRSPRWALGYGALYGSACGWACSWSFAEAASRYFGMGMPLAVLAMCVAYLVVCGSAFGLFAAGSVVLRRGRSPAFARFAIPALWVATELLRARMIAQPWGLLGYTQHAHLGIIQVAALTGVYGVSFLVALGNVVVADVLVLVRARAGVRDVVNAGGLQSAAIAICWSGGTLVAMLGPTGGFGGRTVAVVQTNVQPAFHWTRAYTTRQIMTHVQATESLPDAARPALVVWPENSVPRYLDTEPMLAVQLAQLARQKHADILFGGPRYESGRTYNSIRLITADGRDGGYYDKQHLVLFAEDKPLSRVFASEPDESPREFTAGTHPGVLPSFVRLGVSICHEIIFPELVQGAVRAGAELLVNISNDGWLDGGYGSASRQHFAMSIFRAVEARRYLIRAATTGVSGIIDPYGHVLAATAPGVAQTVTAPVAGRRGLTPYVRFGDMFALLCACAAAGGVLDTRRLPLWRRAGLAPVPTVP